MENIEKIAVNGHYVWVDKDVEIKDGDFCHLKENHYINGGVGKYNTKKAIGYGLHGTKFFSKIVAASPELNLKLK